MARLGNEALEVDGAVAKRALRHLLGRPDHCAQLLGLFDPLHADAAATARRLDQERIADALRLLLEAREIRGRKARATRQHRHACGFGQKTRALLVTHVLDSLGPRADPGEAGGLDPLGEARVLGQETIARMDRVDLRGACGRDHRVHVEIALARGRRPDRLGTVGERHMERVRIRLGIDRDGLQPERLAAADDAAGDLAAVRDQHPLHVRRRVP